MIGGNDDDTTARTSSMNNSSDMDRRSFLFKKLSIASSLSLLASSSSPAAAAVDKNNNKDAFVYFGTGCFWHIQNEFIKAERRLLGRKDIELTSRTGYAGGTKVDSKGRVCYHNLNFAGDYGRMGHAEVVGITIPESKIGDFAQVYFSLFDPNNGDRVDPGDKGREYRYLLGLPGGDRHSQFASIVDAANQDPNKKRLVPGRGGDPDTYRKGIVYYYDTNEFPFYQAEKYHQFHNDFKGPPYGQDYNQLVDLEFNNGGRIMKTGCPDSFDNQTKLRSSIKRFKEQQKQSSS